MKKIKFLAVFLVLAMLLAACGSKEEANENTNATNTDQTNEEGTKDDAAGETSAFPMTIKPTTSQTESEEAGTVLFDEVTFDKMPERIVVFDYGFLDTLDALGVEGIVGLPKASNLPKHLEKYAADEYVSVGTLKEPLLEDIAELQPDVIFISGRQATFYEQLKEITPNVLFVGTSQNEYWDTFLASVDIAAKLFGKEKEAEDYLAQYDSKLEEIRGLAGKYDSALVTMYNEGKLSGFATNSRFGYVYDIYGFTPVTEDIEASSHGSNFGFEAILEYNPEVLFVIDRTSAVGDVSNIEKDMENKIIQQTNAYKNGRIVYLDGALWYLAGGGLTSELAKIDEILNELK